MKIKIPAAFLVLIIIVAACARLEAGTESAAASVPPGLKIISPDHPSTFEVGLNDKVSQSLRWSKDEGLLYLDIT